MYEIKLEIKECNFCNKVVQGVNSIYTYDNIYIMMDNFNSMVETEVKLANKYASNDIYTKEIFIKIFDDGCYSGGLYLYSENGTIKDFNFSIDTVSLF